MVCVKGSSTELLTSRRILGIFGYRKLRQKICIRHWVQMDPGVYLSCKKGRKPHQSSFAENHIIALILLSKHLNRDFEPGTTFKWSLQACVVFGN